MANFNLIAQRIINLSQNTKCFAFNLSTFKAIDNSVQTLDEAYYGIKDVLVANDIASVQSYEEQLIVFVKGARSTFDIIPKELIGRQFVSDTFVFDNTIVTYYRPTIVNMQNILVDARFYAKPIPEYRNRKFVFGGDGRIENRTSNFQKKAFDCNTRGYLTLNPASDIVLGTNNYTFDVVFYGSTNPVNASGKIIAVSILDTRNMQGEGFVLEALLANVYGNYTAYLKYREKNLVLTIPITIQQYVSYNKISLVRYGSYLHIFHNGVKKVTVPNYSYNKYYPFPIWLGAYSGLVNSQYGDGYPRLPFTGIHNSNLTFESLRIVKESVYTTDYDYLYVW